MGKIGDILRYNKIRYNRLKKECGKIEVLYDEILKEKAEKFDKVMRYLEVAEQYKNKLDEQKRISANNKSELMAFKSEIAHYIESIAKYLPKTTKITDEVTFFEYMKRFYYSKMVVPIPTLTKVLNKLNISKETLKTQNEELYNYFKIKKWDIKEKNEE